MKKHMEYIVKVEGRPFYVLDFEKFEVEGETYTVGRGTFRNKISELAKSNQVIFQYKLTYAYYSLPGFDFRIDKAITRDHAGLPQKYGSPTGLYKWLKNQPLEKQALHNFRLIFSAANIWDILAKSCSIQINSSNKDIIFEPWKFIDERDVKVTVHHTDTVSIAIACSSRPIAIDIRDLIDLTEILTRTELKITSICEKLSGTTFSVPSYRTWIVKMWHFGIDIVDRCDSKEFHITFQDGISDLGRIYTKRLSTDKNTRAEFQEYPNKPPIEAILDKIYSGGRLNE